MKKQKRLKVIFERYRFMSPKYNTLPGERFSIEKSELVKELIQDEDVLNYLLNNLTHSGFIKYDQRTEQWVGVDYDGQN